MIVLSLDDLLRELEGLQKKSQQLDQMNKQLGGKNLSDLERELEKLRQKAKAFDDLMGKLKMTDPSKPSYVYINR